MGAKIAHVVVSVDDVLVDLVLGAHTCKQLDLSPGDLITINITKDESRHGAKEICLPRIITEAEWKKLEIANIQAALDQSNGKVCGPNGAAALLGLNKNVVFYRMQRAGIKAK